MLCLVSKGQNQVKSEELRGGHQGQPGPAYPMKKRSNLQENSLPSGTSEEGETARGVIGTNRDIKEEVTKLRGPLC